MTQVKGTAAVQFRVKATLVLPRNNSSESKKFAKFLSASLLLGTWLAPSYTYKCTSPVNFSVNKFFVQGTVVPGFERYTSRGNCVTRVDARRLHLLQKKTANW